MAKLDANGLEGREDREGTREEKEGRCKGEAKKKKGQKNREAEKRERNVIKSWTSACKFRRINSQHKGEQGGGWVHFEGGKRNKSSKGPAAFVDFVGSGPEARYAECYYGDGGVGVRRG